MVCHNLPYVIPPDKGVRHEIDLVPVVKYCVTRQWPLLKKQCDISDNFVRAKHVSNMVRKSKCPHYLHTFCVKRSPSNLIFLAVKALTFRHLVVGTITYKPSLVFYQSRAAVLLYRYDGSTVCCGFL